MKHVKLNKTDLNRQEKRFTEHRSMKQSRDAPLGSNEESKPKRRNYKIDEVVTGEKYKINEDHSPNGKLYEKEVNFVESRGDSRKEETGGAKKPNAKQRLKFSQEETGLGDTGYTGDILVDGQHIETVTKSGKAKNQKTQKSSVVQGRKISQKAVSAASGTTAAMIHRKVSEHEDENSAVKSLHEAEYGAEKTAKFMTERVRARTRKRKNQTLHIDAHSVEEAGKQQATKLYHEAIEKDFKVKESSKLKKQIQKQRIKREYAKAKKAEKSAGTATKGTIEHMKEIGAKVTNFFLEHKKVFLSVGAIAALIFVIVTSVSSCSTVFFQSMVSYAGVSYISSDQAIREADLYYTQLETNLEARINNMESEHPGYDSYRYNVGEIGHDPFVLISYLSAKYEEFTFDETIKNELDQLFASQYQLETETTVENVTETKMVRVGESLGQVVTSGYCSCPICCGIWSGGPTASGVYPTANHTIAVDATNPTVPMGTKVIMNGIEYTVEDTGAFDRYGVDFDVYYDSHSAASAHGHKTWEAFLADANGRREIEVTTTSRQRIFNVTLTNSSLFGVCQSRLNDFQKELFTAYNESKGNLQMFESPLDFNWYYRISSYYGYRIHPISGEISIHNGLDIPAPEGTSIMAGLTGVVSESAYNDSYGNYVVIKDDKGYEIRYAHMSSRSVVAGQSIEKGTEIGLVGNTGTSTGAHLHLEVLHNGERLNPLFYFETGSTMLGGDVEYSSEAAQRLVEYALQFQGVPYVWGGYSPRGFDCSGFVSYCLTNSGVFNTGHRSCDGLLSIMTIIPESEMKAGDIIFFQGTYDTPGASHVGIYIGNGEMVHSGSPNKISNIYSSYYQQHWLCVARW